MADIIANIAKGRIIQYATLPNANDALILIALKSFGLEADATLQDYADVATMLASTNDEATNTGYSRKSITSVTVSVDNTNNWATADIADQTWSAVNATGGAWGKLCLAYDNDTTSGTDSNLVPLAYYDFAVTPNGSDITAVINVSGLFKAA